MAILWSAPAYPCLSDYLRSGVCQLQFLTTDILAIDDDGQVGRWRFVETVYNDAIVSEPGPK